VLLFAPNFAGTKHHNKPSIIYISNNKKAAV
jgi:hypothetical protein